MYQNALHSYAKIRLWHRLLAGYAFKESFKFGGKDARNNEKPEYKNEPDEIEMVKSQSKKRVGCHSVTRWLSFYFNICPFKTMKICQNRFTILQKIK